MARMLIRCCFGALAVLFVASGAQAKECWWQGGRMVCEAPREHRPFWWDHKHEQMYREHEWREHRDYAPRYWERDRWH